MALNKTLTQVRSVALLGVLLTGCSSTIGLVPIMPKHGKSVSAEEIALEWEPSSTQADDLYYQLVIQDKLGKPVYEQNELRETRHVVTAQLAPGRYDWSVRPMYLRSGEWQPGVWTQREWSYFFVFFVSAGKGPYEFRVVQPQSN